MQKIKINVRLLTIMCVLAIFVGIIFAVLYHIQVSRQANAKLEQARKFAEKLEDEENPKIRYDMTVDTYYMYRDYLRTHPEDVDVLSEQAIFLSDQAKWLLENGDRDDATELIWSSYHALEKALRYAKGRKDIRQKFVDMLFKFHHYRMAIHHIRYLSDFPQNKTDLEKLFNRYDLWGQLSDSGFGKKRDLSTFWDYDQKSVNQDRLLDFLGTDFWRIVEDPELLEKLGRSYIALSNLKSATKALEKSILLRSDNLDAYGALIHALRVQNRSEDAEYWVTEVVEANPEAAQAYLIRGSDRLFRINRVKLENAPRVLAEAEWNGLRASQKASQRLLEMADQLIPNDPLTATLKRDFETVINLAPASSEAVTVPYRNALLEVITQMGLAVALMEKQLADTTKAQKSQNRQTESDEATSTSGNQALLKSLIEKDLESCRDGLLLAIACETQKSFIDKKNAKNHLKAARDLGEAVLKIFPKDSFVYRTLANIELEAKNPKAMIQWLFRGSQEADYDPELFCRLGAAFASSGKTKEARDILDLFVKLKEKKLYTLYLEAILEMSEKNWSSAVAKFEEIRPEFITRPINLRNIDILLAQCYGNLNRLKDQREAYSRAATFDRSWDPALLGLAKSRAESGQLREAIQDYELILKLPDPSPERYYEYARILLQHLLGQPKANRSYEALEKAIAKVEEVMPNSPAGTLLRIDLLSAKGKADQARDLLTELQTKATQGRQAVLQERKRLLDEAKTLSGPERTAALDKAKFLLQKSKIYDTHETHLWSKLVMLASQQGDWQKAEETLKKAEGKLGDSPSVRLLRAHTLINNSGKDTASALHVLAENLDDFGPKEKLFLLRRLAMLAITLNDFDQAEKLAKIVLKSEPGDVDMYKILFHADRNRADFQGMKDTLAKLRKIEGKASAFWYHGEAYRLYMLGKKKKQPKLINKAINLLSKASQIEPLWTDPTILLAQILHGQGKLTEASDLYLSAVRNGLQNPKTIEDIARLLTEQRRYKEADEMFDRLSQVRDNGLQEFNMPASYIKARLGDFGQSVEMARKACENSKNYRSFIWLGHVVSIAAKKASEEHQEQKSKALYKEAEQAFLQAIKLHPTGGDVWFGLIQFYGRFDEKEKVDLAIKKAKEAVNPKERGLVLAQVYETLGDIKQAGLYYNKAIRNAPDDINIAQIAALFFLKNNAVAESETLLKRIINKQIDASPQQLAWAKRTLGKLIVHQQGIGDMTQTLQLINENLKVNPKSVLDLYAKANLLAKDPTGLRHAEAIELLTQIESQQSNPDVMVLVALANLYYETDQWTEYKDTMRQVLAKTKDNPVLIRNYTARLTERGEYSEASAWLNNLKRIRPEAISTFIVETNYIFKQKQYDQLIKTMEQWVEKENPKVEHKKRLKVVADISQGYAQKLRDENKPLPAEKLEHQAENWMRQFIQTTPRAELKMAVLHAKQNQVDKALFALRKGLGKNSTDQLCSAIYGIVSEGKLSEEQILEVQKIAKQISDANPQALYPKMMLAYCAEMIGQPRRGELILRDTLKKNPNDANVMNYLAVSLALNKRNLQEAEKLINEAIRKAGPKPDFLDSRAMVAMAQNRPKEAIKDLRDAIVKKPNEPAFYFHLAHALNQEGLRRPAKNALRKAKKLGFRETSLPPIERRHYRRLKLALQE